MTTAIVPVCSDQKDCLGSMVHGDDIMVVLGR